MATPKKPAVKKTATKAPTATKTTKKPAAKSTAAKKTVAAKTPARKAPVRKTSAAAKTTKAKKAPAVRSFRVANEKAGFTSFKITRQTVYWVILIAVIIFAQLWILKVQYEVLDLLDQQLLTSVL